MLESFFKKCAEIKWGFYLMLLILGVFIFNNPDISLTIFAALVFACSINPFVDKLSKKYPRKIVAPVVLTIVLLLILLILVPLIISCGYEIGSFAFSISNNFGNLNTLSLKFPFLAKLGLEKINWDSAISATASMSEWIVNNVVSLLQNLSSVLLYVLLTIIFTFYLIIDREGIKNSTLNLFPKKIRQKTNKIIETITDRLGGYVIAQICTVSSVGIIMLIGLTIFQVPFAPLLAIITAVLDIVPVIGPAIALILCLVSASETGLSAIIVVIITFCLAQLIENNFVRPYAFGKFLNVHPMLIFIALFVATKYLGIAGTLFAPALAATICVLVDELYIKNLNE